MNKELQDKAWAVLPKEFRDEVKALYAKARDMHNIYTSATCINNAESRAIDIWNGKMQVLKELFGESILDIKHAKEKRVEALNLKGLDQASVVERGLTYLEENGKPVCVCYEGESKLRLQVATAAMQGILSNKILYEATLDAGEKHSVESKTAISRVALSFADALLGR